MRRIISFIGFCLLVFGFTALTIKEKLKAEIVAFNKVLNSDDLSLKIVTTSYAGVESERRNMMVIKKAGVKNYVLDKMLVVEQGGENITVDLANKRVYYSVFGGKTTAKGVIDTAAMFTETSVVTMSTGQKEETSYKINDTAGPGRIELTFQKRIGLQKMSIAYTKGTSAIDSTTVTYKRLKTELQLISVSDIVSKESENILQLTEKYSGYQLIDNTKH